VHYVYVSIKESMMTHFSISDYVLKNNSSQHLRASI
jgi:hypothetical protein